MSDFAVEMRRRIDRDGLVGRTENPTPWTEGNPILESVTAIVLELKVGGKDADAAFIRGICNAVLRCQLPSGTFNKNPDRPDEITHDDLKAAAGLTRIISATLTRPLAGRLCALGRSNGWNLANTHPPYWNAFARPWDVAYYELCDSQAPAWFNLALLCGSYILGAILLFCGKTNPSGDRLKWVSLEAVGSASPWVGLSGALWRFAANRAYVDVGTMLSWYYENPSHPYARWGRGVRF